MRARTFSTWALCALALGCGERREGVAVAPRIVAMARLGSELAFVEANRSEVSVVDVMKPSVADVTRIDVGANPRLAIERTVGAMSPVLGSSAAATEASSLQQRRLAPKEVLVLSDGEVDGGGDYVEKPSLTVVTSEHKTRKYVLSSPFAKIELSPDGSRAVLWGQDSSRGLLSNPNRVAVVDLDAEPATGINPFERTLKATGGTVQSVLITPDITYVERHSLVLFSFSNGLSAWDIAHPANEDITLEGLSNNAAFRLTRVVVDSSKAQLYLAQESQTDLRVLSLQERDPGSTNNFRLALNQLPLGSKAATDMVFYTEQSDAKALVTNGSELGIVDANDSRVATVKLAKAGNRLYSFVGKSPNDNDTKQRILVWGEGLSVVSFVELANLEKAGAQNIEELPLGSGFVLEDLVPLSENLLLTVLSNRGIGTLDLQARRFRPLSAAVELSSPLVETDARRVWVGGAGLGAPDQVGFFEPATLATGSVSLDVRAHSLFLFEDGEQRKLVATHDSPIGEMTIVDASKVTRASSLVLTGFLVDGLVDR